VEMLVAVFVFTLLISFLSGTAASVIKSQRKVYALQGVQEAGRFVLESMIKEIRTSRVNSVGGLRQDLQITNDKGIDVIYQFTNGADNIAYRQGQPISPSGVNLTGSFYVRKYVLPEHAVVTIVLELGSVSVEGKPETQSKINLQGTISSRAFPE